MKDELNRFKTATSNNFGDLQKQKSLEPRFHPSSFILHPSSERGAALVAVLAFLAIMAFVLLAAAPSIYQQVLRERELEAMRRGDEIAEAIRIYAQVNQRLPQKMDDLLEGVKLPGRTKPLMILRESAARDPLSSSGEWKLIQSNDTKTIANFRSKLTVYTGNNVVQNPQPINVFDPIAGASISRAIDIETSEEINPPGDEDESENTEGPFVGVVSRARTKSVMTYYGIGRHDWWLFTPLFRGTGGNNNGGGGTIEPKTE